MKEGCCLKCKRVIKNCAYCGNALLVGQDRFACGMEKGHIHLQCYDKAAMKNAQRSLQKRY